jgi:hypothetical protein
MCGGRVDGQLIKINADIVVQQVNGQLGAFDAAGKHVQYKRSKIRNTLHSSVK